MTFERDDNGLAIVSLDYDVLRRESRVEHIRDVVVAPGVVEMHDGETIGDWLCRHGRDQNDEGAQLLYVALANERGARPGIPERYHHAWKAAVNG